MPASETFPAPRIALFLPRLSRYGGVENFSWRLADCLTRDGMRVTFVCGRAETEPPRGVELVRLGRPRGPRFVKIAAFARAVEQHRREHAADYDLTMSMGKTRGQDLLRVSGGPLTIFWRLTERGYAPGLPRTLKTLARRLDPAAPLIRSIEAEQLVNARRIVAVSERTVDWLLEAHPGLRREEIRVIYNRPDLERFAPVGEDERQALRRAANVTPGQVVLGSGGTSFPRKGLGTVIRALPLLPTNHVLRVAGGRNPAMYQTLAKELGVAERVTFLGRVDTMAAYYNTLDCFVLPSLYDTCSNAVPEALACGCPTVGSVDDGSSRFLDAAATVQDPTDPAELARAVATVLARPRPTSFAWPEDLPAGVEAYPALLRELLADMASGRA